MVIEDGDGMDLEFSWRSLFDFDGDFGLLVKFEELKMFDPSIESISVNF